MAGELTAADMLYPKVGQIKADAVWPDEPLRTVLKDLGELLRLGYLKATADALTDEAKNTGAMHWTRYLAYGGAYQSLVGLPTSVDARDEGSSSYLLTQLTLMAGLRDQALADYTDVVAGANPVTASAPRSSRTTRACFEIV